MFAIVVDRFDTMGDVRARHVAGAALAGGLGTVAGAAGVAGTAVYFARRIVTPGDPVNDTRVREFTDLTITVDAGPQTTAPGRYGLWVGADAHLRMGDLLDVHGKRATRELLGVDFGELRTGPARVDGHYYVGPPATSLPVPLTNVAYDGPLGAMPAWEVRVPDSTRWAILVHGRGAVRAECLRAVPVLNACGINALVVAYRNDPGAPPGPDGLYNLGLTEWHDVEAAMSYAVTNGATDLMLFGWSMGGATVLQTADRAEHADLISRIVLDSPVVDWVSVLAFQAGLNHVPRSVGRMAQQLLGSRFHRAMVGLHEPIDLHRTDWLTRSDELTKPILLIHSADDDFVPFQPSAKLAELRPDLVRLAQFEVAGHCREWNVDPDRWERLVRNFCAPQLVP